MKTRGQDVRQAGQVQNLFHRLGFVRELEQVEVGIGDHHVLGLTADPAAHVHITIGTAGSCRVDVQTHSRRALLTVPAAATGNVERHGNEVSNLDEFRIAPGFDHLAGDLVTQDESHRRRGTTSHHVLIASTDIGGHNFQNHSVIASPAARTHELRKVNALDLNLARSDVGDTPIACHDLLLVQIR